MSLTFPLMTIVKSHVEKGSFVNVRENAAQVSRSQTAETKCVIFGAFLNTIVEASDRVESSDAVGVLR